MIVLGISPGMKALAYSVMRSGTPPCPIDHDVLLGGRIKNSLADLDKKAHVHALVLEVVLERDPPTVIALGPPSNSKESPEQHAAIRRMLERLAATFAVKIVDLTDPLMMSTLCIARESLPRAVNRHLGPETPLDTDDPRLVRAMGAALAGIFLWSGK